MGKKEGIILGLISLTVFVIFILITSSHPMSLKGKKTNSNLAVEKLVVVDMGVLEDEYKLITKELIGGYSGLLGKLELDDFESLEKEDTEDAIIRVAQIRSELLKLRMPEEFQDLHWDLVRATIIIEDYLVNGGADSVLVSKDIIDQAKIDYSWLN